jgi:hypothetical protein
MTKREIQRAQVCVFDHTTKKIERNNNKQNKTNKKKIFVAGTANR